MGLEAADIANLKTARTNLAAKIAEVSANPLPTYSVGDRSFSWVEYYRWLLEQLKEIDTTIATEESGDNGAWEVRSSGYV